MSPSLSGCGLALKTGQGQRRGKGMMLAVNKYLCRTAEIKLSISFRGQPGDKAIGKAGYEGC